jgi:periplasmic copper chaperone A
VRHGPHALRYHARRLWLNRAAFMIPILKTRFVLPYLVLLAALLATGSNSAFAQGDTVVIAHAWIRATVPGQTGSGAFMTLQSSDAEKLVGASTPRAGVAQVHEMKSDGSMMTMRAVASLELPAGQPVELRPNSFHIMLMDLKGALANGDKVPLTLKFTKADGTSHDQTVMVEVRQSAPVN